MSAPKVGALFAGYGGLELAVREVFPAARPAWVAEFDAGPSRILAQRFPDVPNLGDVTAVDWAAVEPVDIITGGSPCPDLSTAGKQAGMRPGTRSGLWASMADAVSIIRPSLVVWENVRGALSACAHSAIDRELGPCPRCMDLDSGAAHAPNVRALGRVLGDLSSIGYDAAWTVVRASDVGAPHRRERVFVLAWPADAPGPGLEARREGRRGGGALADATSDPWWLRDGDGGAPAGLGGRAADLTLLRTPTAQLAVNGGSQHPEKRKAGGHGPTLADEVEHLLPTPRATDGTKGGPNQRGSSGDLMLPSAVLRFGPYARAIARWEPVMRRPAPAPTEPTGKGGAHRLSPRFVEWMQGLAEGWVTDTDTTRNEQLKALGNGVVPQQAAAAIRHLLGVRAAAMAGMEAVA